MLKFSILKIACLLALLATACNQDSNDASDAGGSADATTMGLVPTDTQALFTFLESGAYTDFPSEPAPHASTGPHGQVRSFFNEALAASLGAENSSHPVGSASVKELYSDDALTGWAVVIKTADTGAASDWFFYENLSTTDGSSPVANGQGVGGCANCHGDGADYILTSFP